MIVYHLTLNNERLTNRLAELCSKMLCEQWNCVDDQCIQGWSNLQL
jgi:hypothetical protein